MAELLYHKEKGPRGYWILQDKGLTLKDSESPLPPGLGMKICIATKKVTPIETKKGLVRGSFGAWISSSVPLT